MPLFVLVISITPERHSVTGRTAMQSVHMAAAFLASSPITVLTHMCLVVHACSVILTMQSDTAVEIGSQAQLGAHSTCSYSSFSQRERDIIDAGPDVSDAHHLYDNILC
jgi:hypothetical protein